MTLTRTGARPSSRDAGASSPLSSFYYSSLQQKSTLGVSGGHLCSTGTGDTMTSGGFKKALLHSELWAALGLQTARRPETGAPCNMGMALCWLFSCYHVHLVPAQRSQQDSCAWVMHCPCILRGVHGGVDRFMQRHLASPVQKPGQFPPCHTAKKSAYSL